MFTVNPLYTDIWYNNKTRYNDYLNRTNLQLNVKQIIGDIKQYCI